jgi:hypothetical protein
LVSWIEELELQVAHIICKLFVENKNIEGGVGGAHFPPRDFHSFTVSQFYRGVPFPVSGRSRSGLVLSMIVRCRAIILCNADVEALKLMGG